MAIKTPFLLFVYILIFIVIQPSLGRHHILPDHPYIRYHGRVETHKPHCVRFDWSGIRIEALFEGTSCLIELAGSCERYEVFIDGTFTHSFKSEIPFQRYMIASGLRDTVHHLLIFKRYITEGHITECTGLVIDDHRHLRKLPPPPPYRIEFIGSSSLIGYGNEAGTTLCDSIEKYSNSNLSYGPVVARMLGADYSLLGLIGRGMVRNYGSPFLASARPFPVYYRRTLWNKADGPQWNYHTWVPDVIVLTLGINDFSSKPNPPQTLFYHRYYSFVRELYTMYPNVHIVCLTSSKEPYYSNVKNFVEREISEGNNNISFFSHKKVPDWERGCNWHPNVKAHRRIAEKLADVLRPILEKKRKK